MLVDSKVGPGHGPAGPYHPRTNATAMTMYGRNPQPSLTSPDIITQAELAKYHAGRTRLKQLEEELEAQRQDLIQRLDDGAPIEPGQFRAEVRKFTQRPITAKSLGQVLSPDELERLKNLIPPTHRAYLHVTQDP
jgi:hypothetical protein